jgi:hypothetical protein
MDPTDDQNEDLNEWIILTKNLLQDMGAHNCLAPGAVQGLDIIRKYTGLFGLNEPSSRTETVHYLERSTHTLAQTQPSVSDLLDETFATDPWSTQTVGIYSNHFPSIEVLCGNPNPQVLERFLDSCMTTDI